MATRLRFEAPPSPKVLSTLSFSAMYAQYTHALLEGIMPHLPRQFRMEYAIPLSKKCEFFFQQVTGSTYKDTPEHVEEAIDASHLIISLLQSVTELPKDKQHKVFEYINQLHNE